MRAEVNLPERMVENSPQQKTQNHPVDKITEKNSEVAILASNGKTDGSMYHNFQRRCIIS